MSDNVKFADLSFDSFPFEIHFFRVEDNVRVWHAVVEGPGALKVPGVKGDHGEVWVLTEYGDGDTSEVWPDG